MPGYRCPKCAQPLVEEATGFACAAGHRYDRAKEGYVNLLPGGRRKGNPAGDDHAMVRARRTIFDAGLYAPVIDAVAATVHRAARRAGPPGEHDALRLLDCGSGEGSYLAAVSARTAAGAWGIDVSKAAVRVAARRHHDHHYAVASVYHLPFADGSFDVLMSVFSPRPHAEMVRVLDTDGIAVLVRPGPQHLAELKALVYADPRRHRDPATAEGEEWPDVPTELITVAFDVVLDDPSLRLALLEMTPYWWSTGPELRAEIAATPLTAHADMRIAVFDRPR